MPAPQFSASSKRPTTRTGGPLGTFRIAMLAGYSDLVAEMGGKPAKLLARCGLDAHIFSDDDNVIPFGLFLRLLALAAEETRCPHFALLLAQRRNPLSTVGPIGFLVQNSPTVGDALRNLVGFIHLCVVGPTMTLQVQAGEVILSISTELSDGPGTEQTMDLGIANLFLTMRMLAGREWLPSAVHFARQQPWDVAPYVAFFRAPVHFDRKATCLRFPSFWLERPVPDADTELCALMKSYAKKIEQQYSGDFRGQARHVVRTMLPTSKCTAVRIAELFSLSLRTLQRRLTESGTTFEALVDETRFEIATSKLAQTSTPIRQLAALLGYRDSRTFSRAFRRWSGLAPAQWRAQRRVAAADPR